MKNERNKERKIHINREKNETLQDRDTVDFLILAVVIQRVLYNNTECINIMWKFKH